MRIVGTLREIEGGEKSITGSDMPKLEDTIWKCIDSWHYYIEIEQDIYSIIDMEKPLIKQGKRDLRK